jgi:pimeloyl-ACP methyl ester carboxylesterase
VNVSGIVAGPLGAPRVTLIHGLAGSHRTWERLIPLLQDRFRLLAVNLVGGQPIQDEADRISALFTGSSLVVGHSMGGLVGTALAERHPELVSHLTLINSPPSVESRRSVRSAGERVLRIPVLGDLAWRLGGDKGRRSGLQTAFAPGTKVPPPLLADLRATGRRRLVGSSSAIDTYLTTRPLTDRLTALRIPVDIVFGSRDQRVDPASLHLYEGLPNVRIGCIERSGHTPPWESPEAVAAAITSAADPQRKWSLKR